MLGLEGCLAGRAPGGQVFTDVPAPAACAELAELQPARVVFGPATFLNEAVTRATELMATELQGAQTRAQQAGERAAQEALEAGADPATAQAQGQAAAQAVLDQAFGEFSALAEKYGQTGIPRLDDPNFVRAVVFDPERKGGVPKARFASLFPSAEAALIAVRLRNDLSTEDRRDAIALIREATEDPLFEMANGSYLISGIPVVTEALADRLAGELVILLSLAVALMAITLFAALRAPGRFLPLGVALGAAGIVFGISSLAGGSLSLAALAVLPVMVGLAVDYAIQLHARFREALDTGLTPERAAVAAAETWGPQLGVAALATSVGFAALLIAPLEIVRTFGLLLLAGIAAGLLLSLTSGMAALALMVSPAGKRPDGAAGAVDAFGQRLSARFAPLGARATRAGRATLALGITRPREVLAVALVLAGTGWALQPSLEVESDVRKLVESDLSELRDVDEIERLTGVGGELSIAVSGEGVTRPATIEWMADVKAEILEANGYDELTPCNESDAAICPAAALPDLFGEGRPTRDEVRAILDAVPEYFSQAVLTPPGVEPTTAAITFGIRQTPLDEQKRLVEGIREVLRGEGSSGPAPGDVEAEAVGLPVLAADANSALADARHWLPVAGIIAVILVLAFVRRSPRRVIGPVVPVILATGWSSLVLWLMGVSLNPMSATLGALVVAIGTEFGVILEARFREERDGGAAIGEALRSTFSRTGVAVIASAATAIAGFGVLAFSGIGMLSEFGLVTVVDLTVAVVGVLVLLPAVLVMLEPDG